MQAEPLDKKMQVRSLPEGTFEGGSSGALPSQEEDEVRVYVVAHHHDRIGMHQPPAHLEQE